MISLRRTGSRRRLLLEGLELRRLFTFAVASPIADLASYNPSSTVSLAGHFHDPSASNTTVRLHFVTAGNATASGDVDIQLTDSVTPLTVANFLNYVNSGRFNNTIIHRSVAGFVVQGGGYTGSTFSTLTHISTDAPVQNEFTADQTAAGGGPVNIRGTIAMAKVGGDPNSATSEWFINLADNSSNLDTQNGGFTTFGTVAGSGMNLFDAIAGIPVYQGGSFTNLPLVNYSTGDPTTANFVNLASATAECTYAITGDDNSSLFSSISITGSQLQLNYARGHYGTANLTVTATDFAGNQASTTFAVTTSNPMSASVDGNALSDNQSTPVDFGTTNQGISTSKAFTLTNNSDAVIPLLAPTVPSGFMITSPVVLQNGQIVPNLPALAPHSSVTVTVAVRVDTGGVKSGTLVFNTNNPALSFSIPMTATVDYRQLAVSYNSAGLTDNQSALALPSAVEGTSDQVSFTIANTGDGMDLSNLSVVVPTGFSVVTPPPASLAPGASATVVLSVDTSSPGTRSGTIYVKSDDPLYALQNSNFRVNVAAAVHYRRLAVSNSSGALSSYSSYTFPTTLQGDISPTCTFHISNTGDIPLSLLSPSVPAGFVLLNSLPATLAANASVDAVLAVDTSLSRGTRSGVFSFSTDDVKNPSFAVNLSATIFAKGLAVAMAGQAIPFGTASTVNFGRVSRGDTSHQVTFSLSNQGLVPLSISSVALPVGYTVVGSSPASIPAGQAVQLTVGLDAANPGTYDGTLSIASSDPDRPSFDIPLAASVSLPVILGAGGSSTVTFTDADGTATTLALSGPGSAQLDFFGDNLSTSTNTKKKTAAVSGSSVTLGDITFSNTKAASKLTITTKGGNKSVDLGDLSGSAIGMISAPTARLTGTATLAGLKSLALGAASGATLNVNSGAAITFAAAVSGTTLTAGGAIASLTAPSWSAGSISAGSIGNLTINGAFSGTLSVSGKITTASIKGAIASSTWQAGAINSLTAASIASSSLAAASINSATIKGDITSSTLRTSGKITTLSAGNLVDSNLYAGVSSSLASGLPASAGDLSGNASITSLTLKGLRDSSVAARTLTRVSVGKITSFNNGTPLGFAAHSINSLTAKLDTGKSLRLANVTSAASLAKQLAAQKLTSLNDLDIVLV